MSLIFATFILIEGHRLNVGSTAFVICNEDDNQHWNIEYRPGKLFCMFHIILILVGAIQAERVFYSIPHRMGYFDEIKPDQYDHSFSPSGHN